MKLIAAGVTKSAANTVAFVFAVFLIDQHHHAAGFQFGDDFLGARHRLRLDHGGDVWINDV